MVKDFAVQNSTVEPAPQRLRGKTFQEPSNRSGEEGGAMRATGMLFLLAIATFSAGCGGNHGFTAPAPVPQTRALVVFVDLDSDFSTADVYDAEGEIVHFTPSGELIWSDGLRFKGYLADGRVITAEGVCAGCYFFVRFGTRDGERRAYLTWPTPATAEQPATVLDLDVVAGVLVARDTDVAVPGAK
jgi:hypothetical protein